jgi:hypothetical protein
MNDWQKSTTIEYVQIKDDYPRQLLLACSLGLNIGFIIALLFL